MTGEVKLQTLKRMMKIVELYKKFMITKQSKEAVQFLKVKAMDKEKVTAKCIEEFYMHTCTRETAKLFT